MQWEPARTCQHLVREDWLPFQESHSQQTRPSPFHCPRRVHILKKCPPDCSLSSGCVCNRHRPAPTHHSCWPASDARAHHRQPPVSSERCIVLQTHVSQSRHPCWPEVSGLGNQSATQPMPSGRLRFPNASFVHAHHVAVQRIDTKVPERFWATPRACFPPPCRAELHRSASDAAFTLLQTSPGK